MDLFGFLANLIAATFRVSTPILLAATGETYAVPIWAKFMGEALGERGEVKFESPGDIMSARICEESGLLATSKCTRVIAESFLEGTVPTKFCDMHEPPDFALRDGEKSSGGAPPGEPRPPL